MTSIDLTLLTELAARIPIKTLLSYLPGDATPGRRRRFIELHEGLQSGAWGDDKAAVRALYGKTRSTRHAPYLQLKSDFAWAALRVALEPKGRYQSRPNRQDRFLRCERLLAILALVHNDAPDVETKAWKRLRRVALNCGHTAVVLKCTRRLMSTYGFRRPDNRILAKLSQELHQSVKQFAAENTCRHIALQLRADSDSKLLDPDPKLLAKLVKKYPVYDVQYYGREALAGIYLDQGRFDCLQLCTQEALEYFTTHYPNESQPQQHFLYLSAMGYLSQQDADRGFEMINRLIGHLSAQRLKPQLVKALELGMLLALRTNRPLLALPLLEQLDNLGGPSALQFHDRGRWRVYLTGINLLASEEQLGAIEPVVKSHLRRLAWGGKKETLFAEDKLTLEVFDILGLLKDGKYRRAASKVGQISKQLLVGRVKSMDITYRRHLFGKWLLAAAKANFHRVATPRKTAAVERAIALTMPSIQIEQLEYEPICFEDLIAIARQHLTSRVPSTPYQV